MMKRPDFEKWFLANSGYAQHSARASALPEPCTGNLRDMGGSVMLRDHSGPVCCRLFACTHCEKIYAKTTNGFVEIDNLLRYQVFMDSED